MIGADKDLEVGTSALRCLVRDYEPKGRRCWHVLSHILNFDIAPVYHHVETIEQFGPA